MHERIWAKAVRVIEVLEELADRLQVAMIVAERDGDSLKLKIVNNTAAILFGYPTAAAMRGLDVKSLMPPKYAEHHDEHIIKYHQRKGAMQRPSSIMGQWRELEALSATGEMIPVAANVADIKNDTERYFVAIFQDRRKEKEEKLQLEDSLLKLAAAKEQADQMRAAAEEAMKSAESNLLKQKKLSAQVSLLRQIFLGTLGLIVLLAVLVVIGWLSGQYEKDSLAMFERILLVLTGMLGSAMAGVFDSRNGSRDEKK